MAQTVFDVGLTLLDDVDGLAIGFLWMRRHANWWFCAAIGLVGTSSGCSLLFDESAATGDAGTGGAADAAKTPLTCDLLVQDTPLLEVLSSGEINGGTPTPHGVDDLNPGLCGASLDLSNGYLEISEHDLAQDFLAFDFFVRIDSAALGDGGTVFSFDNRGANVGDLTLMAESYAGSAGAGVRLVARLQDGVDSDFGNGYFLCGPAMTIGDWHRVQIEVGLTRDIHMWIDGIDSTTEGATFILGVGTATCGDPLVHNPNVTFVGNGGNLYIGSFLATTSGNKDFSLTNGSVDDFRVYAQPIVIP